MKQKLTNETTEPPSIEEQLRSKKTLLSVEELADLFNCSTKQIYKLVRGGLIPAYRVGMLIRFDPKAVSAWLRGRATVVKQKP